jgi:hypothetical protein
VLKERIGYERCGKDQKECKQGSGRKDIYKKMSQGGRVKLKTGIKRGRRSVHWKGRTDQTKDKEEWKVGA